MTHHEKLTKEIKHSLPCDAPYKNTHFKFGLLALFCYVGSEVSIANFLLPFVLAGCHANTSTSLAQAASWVSTYWALQLLGRIVGASLLNKMRTEIALFVCALSACSLIAGALLLPHHYGLPCLVLVGLANAIMYPSIFSLSLKNLAHVEAKASGFLHMAVVGGAIIPMLQGLIADHTGVIHSYLLPGTLYLIIASFALYSLPLLNDRQKMVSDS